MQYVISNIKHTSAHLYWCFQLGKWCTSYNFQTRSREAGCDFISWSHMWSRPEPCLPELAFIWIGSLHELCGLMQQGRQVLGSRYWDCLETEQCSLCWVAKFNFLAWAATAARPADQCSGARTMLAQQQMPQTVCYRGQSWAAVPAGKPAPRGSWVPVPSCGVSCAPRGLSPQHHRPGEYSWAGALELRLPPYAMSHLETCNHQGRCSSS